MITEVVKFIKYWIWSNC